MCVPRSDFEFASIRQVFVEMNNVFKAAPEITFWAGERFYRFGIDPMDYFWLDMSGYGAGVKNVNVGIGELFVAYLAGLDDDFNSPTEGSFYKHNLDVEWRHIPLVYRLTYNDDVAAGQLAVFQGASDEHI
jgi:maltoporin